MVVILSAGHHLRHGGVLTVYKSKSPSLYDLSLGRPKLRKNGRLNHRARVRTANPEWPNWAIQLQP
jgi:hypothetical protein